jgi:hypothetical protein
MGIMGSFSRVKQQGREADLLPSPSFEAKKTRIYISTPPYILMA